MVPPERAHNALKFLEDSGFHPEFHEYDMGHEISNEVLNDLIPWMDKILPPQQAGK